MGPPSYSCGGTSVPTWDPPGRRCCNIVALQVLGSSQRGVGWAVGRPGSVRLGGGVDRDRGRRPANATPGPERVRQRAESSAPFSTGVSSGASQRPPLEQQKADREGRQGCRNHGWAIPGPPRPSSLSFFSGPLVHVFCLCSLGTLSRANAALWPLRSLPAPPVLPGVPDGGGRARARDSGRRRA